MSGAVSPTHHHPSAAMHTDVSTLLMSFKKIVAVAALVLSFPNVQEWTHLGWRSQESAKQHLTLSAAATDAAIKAVGRQ